MLIRFVLAALVALTPLAVSAQESPAPRPATVKVTLETSAGPIVLELESERAPATTANFLQYVDKKRLDGTSFYRAMRMNPEYGLVQGGVRFDAAKLLPNIKHEPTSETGLSHVSGAISMARSAPGSANGDFFIVVGDLTGLDANPKAEGDNLGFAVFGRVVEGMEVVRKIMDSPTSPTEGVGIMRGQMLAPTIAIVSARRTP